MQFSELYGAALDHELGSYDTTQLFTTARRKYAINRAQKEFARLAKISLSREVILPLITGQARYDFDAASLNRFVSFGRAPLRLRHTVAATGAVSATPVLVRSVAYLDEVKPGWRDSTSRGVPENVGARPGQRRELAGLPAHPVGDAERDVGSHRPDSGERRRHAERHRRAVRRATGHRAVPLGRSRTSRRRCWSGCGKTPRPSRRRCRSSARIWKTGTRRAPARRARTRRC